MTSLAATSSESEAVSTAQQLTVSYWNDAHRPPYAVVETRTRGRGQVILADSERGTGDGKVGNGGGLRIAVVSEVDAAHGELASDPPARVDRRLVYRYGRRSERCLHRQTFVPSVTHSRRHRMHYDIGGYRTTSWGRIRRACTGRCRRCGGGPRCCYGLENGENWEVTRLYS